MPRLIDADAANVERICCYYGDNCRTEDVQKWLDDQPTIDAEPVRHGRWDDNAVAFCNVCSVCGVAVDRTSCFPTIMRKGVVQPRTGELNYCPNCGAKIDGGANDVTNA